MTFASKEHQHNIFIQHNNQMAKWHSLINSFLTQTTITVCTLFDQQRILMNTFDYYYLLLFHGDTHSAIVSDRYEIQLSLSVYISLLICR